MNDSRQGPANMPRLSHAEAEQLISTRLDTPLPSDQNRVLLAHLSTCPSCRAFAAQIEAMSHGLRGLPMLPASPTVSRQVRERLAEGQSSWSRFSRLLVNGRWGAMPAMASALVLVAVVAFSLIFRGDNDSGNNRTPIPAASSTDIALTTETSQTPESTQVPPTNTPYVKPRDESKPTLPNVQVQVTETLDPLSTPLATSTADATETLIPSATASATPSNTPVSTETATMAPSSTPEPTETSTLEPTETPRPTETATSEPVETPEPTETATRKPTETPEPTATASNTPLPTRTPTEQATESVTPTATRTETATSTATHTQTPEPTATRTPTERPTETATPRPTRTATPESTETNTPDPTETATLKPTRTPEPTETPAEQVQPKIVPVGGGDPTEATEEPTSEPESTEVVIEYETPIEEAADTTAESTIRIQPKGTATGATDEIPTEESGSSTDTTLADPSGTEEGSGTGLTGAKELGAIESGVSAPAGGLKMPFDLAYFVITSPDGSLAVADTSGNLIHSLGAAAFPVWSPKGLVLAYEDLSGELPAVMSWDREDGGVYAIGAESEIPVADVPAGWVGSQIYYLRSFPDSPGTVELRRADWDGGNDEIVWTAEGIDLSGERPVATLDGVLIPTSNSWMFVNVAGGVSELTASSGFVGEPLLSPFGSLVAYPVGDQLIVAPTADPGSPQVVIPYPDGYSGFDFSPDGSQMVVSDGTTLLIYTTDDGSLISQSSDGSAVAFPHWSDDGIRYLALGNPTLLMLIQPEDFDYVG